MPLTNSIKILEKALKNKYAVPAFNVYNMESVGAVVSVAERLKKNVILAVSESSIDYAGLEMITNIVKVAANKAKINVALHLDHGKNRKLIKDAILAGFTSVMFDGSELPLEENIKKTKEIVDFAHSHGVSVEGELGKIMNEEEIKASGGNFTDENEAKEFYQKTGVDSLAISIGTKHGVNKSTTTPTINFEVIERVSKVLPSLPLVAHGSSSVPKPLVDKINNFGGEIKNGVGIDAETLKRMSKTHICKINVDTDLRLAFTSGLRFELYSQPTKFDPRTILGVARSDMERQIEQIFEIIG